ncbi:MULTISPECIES: hypothetical protein [unclassified Undibacterium]|uniref:hypothetical protein n=1 Tax=unclassified Undibacterium TaxID=2630295 RepID=UPI002AC9C3F5|nr:MULTISPECIES: hypothetical protein [unclassified Undibacterium]MEB0138503.1 hypothetical protein [Undibacterium sp. CCC2.1]MEB0173096.1 hypothetical protein [Undibacterium sp. CCC1.1]MEB0176148.1 hypothetical protein [Undibacterium sp. CCC3.4]MEB0215414.1 hypothetical protein [Undibacterium sp. 5I2]WPX42755.1 hypothetical protein RHM61_15395 [Undibacterium sp. CCC3.4]
MPNISVITHTSYFSTQNQLTPASNGLAAPQPLTSSSLRQASNLVGSGDTLTGVVAGPNRIALGAQAVSVITNSQRLAQASVRMVESRPEGSARYARLREVDRPALTAGFVCPNGTDMRAPLDNSHRAPPSPASGSMSGTSSGVGKRQRNLCYREHAARIGGFLTADGAPDLVAYHRHISERCAAKLGLIAANGSADIRAYNRYMLARAAIAAGFVKHDGSANVYAYKRNRTAESAVAAGFVKLDGTADSIGYRRHFTARAALRTGFTSTDGGADLAGYRSDQLQRTAQKSGFLTPTGAPDVTAYKRQLARDLAKKAGFVNPAGEGDVTAYRRQRQWYRNDRLGSVAGAVTKGKNVPEALTRPGRS